MLVGRGRGHVSTDRREQLRRPADVAYVSPLDGIATKIAELKVDSPAELNVIKEDISKHCSSADKLKLMVSDLHERSLVNRKFGTKCAMALATQSQLTVDGKKLRAILMTNIQTDFEDKENLRHHNMNRFLNTFAFIGEVFRYIRLADGTPITVLAMALIEYCKLLVAGTEPEVELCVQQLAYNGKLLQKWNPQQLAELQVLIRTACMVPGTDARCLCWLHLACDLDRFAYGPLSSELRDLYKTKLGATAMATVHDLLVAPDPVLPEEEQPDVVLSLGAVKIDPRSETKHNGRAIKKAATGHAGGGDSISDKAPREPEPPTSPNPAGDNGGHRGGLDPRNNPEADNGGRRGGAEPRNDNSGRQGATDPRTNNSGGYSGGRRGGADPRNNPAGDNRGQRRGADPRTDNGGRRRNTDPRNDPANWLPREPMSEQDRDIWGPSERRRGGGQSYGHDDRFDREDDFYTARREGKGGKSAPAPARPPPVPAASTEESWD